MSEKETLYKFLGFLETCGYMIATLIPKKGLVTVAQAEKLKLVEEILGQTE